MDRPVREFAQIALVVAAWALFLGSPFLFLGAEAAQGYVEGLVSAFLLWVPLVVATFATFVTPRRAGIAVSCVLLAVPLFMVLSYGSGIGVLWTGVGSLVLAANLLRPREPVASVSA